MEFNGNVDDQFPPLFIQFRDFYDEQRKDLLEGFSKQREEMFENFTTFVDEKNKLIEMNIIKIKNLTHEVSEMKVREDAYESDINFATLGNEKLKIESAETKKK